MKANVLIAYLRELVKEHGDLPVVFYDDQDHDIATVEYNDDDARVFILETS